MEKLTLKEEQALQVIWEVGKGFVKDFLEAYPDPKPHYNTVSSMVRSLEEKGYVGHKAYGNTFEYHPIVTKEEYSKKFLSGFIGKYFDHSYKRVVSFFAKEQNISVEDLKEIIKMIEKEKE